jgi:hypothetical protein
VRDDRPTLDYANPRNTPRSHPVRAVAVSAVGILMSAIAVLLLVLSLLNFFTMLVPPFHWLYLGETLALAGLAAFAALAARHCYRESRRLMRGLDERG